MRFNFLFKSGKKWENSFVFICVWNTTTIFVSEVWNGCFVGSFDRCVDEDNLVSSRCPRKDTDKDSTKVNHRLCWRKERVSLTSRPLITWFPSIDRNHPFCRRPMLSIPIVAHSISFCIVFIKCNTLPSSLNRIKCGIKN